MKILYWYKVCPFCNEGRLFVFKNININKLYLHCEECESGYYDIEHVETGDRFLTLLDEFEASPATYADILETGWHYDFNAIIE